LSDSANARPGFELPLLLLGGFRALIDELHAELARQGHPDARPMHGFVLQAIGRDGATATELGHRLGVSKQAAGKLIRTLQALGYVEPAPPEADARRKPVLISSRGLDLLACSATIFETLRDGWASRIGAGRLEALEDDLESVLPAGAARLLDIPGWLTRADHG
jgi:DNA-binding MarR family transcriptional regulator